MKERPEVTGPEPIPVLDAPGVRHVLEALAGAIASRHGRTGELFFAGIPTRGVEIARRLCELVGRNLGKVFRCGAVDISFYRDDLSLRPGLRAPQATELPLDMANCTVVLVDDVLFTGRSVRAALEALHAYGRPGRVELAVLIDRGHRQLPIQPDFTGLKLQTDFSDRIRVRLEELDGIPDGVWLVPAGEPGTQAGVQRGGQGTGAA